MPNGDGTGPNGEGSMTGRRMGSCAENLPQRNLPKRGFGRGLGRGMGFRRWFR